jgi:metacaspase-1
MAFPGRRNRQNRNIVTRSQPIIPAGINPEFQQQTASLIPAEVRLISGCHSEQTSADVSNVNAIAQLPNPAGRAGGACTSALLEILYRHASNNLTFQDLLIQLRQSLANKGLEQIPQLTSSRPLELQHTPFSLAGNPNGRRRALLIGINYIGQNGQLSGCHNDVLNVKKYIAQYHQFPEQDMIALLDDGRHPLPTRSNIIGALQQLVQQSVAGDSVYLHYSGHGGLLSPENFNAFKFNNSERGKAYDETLFPVDHNHSGQIRDFSLFHHFVQPMAAGVVVTCVMDCCHSGSVLDLPYSFQPTPAGTIQMRENMSSLSNLAFLYILAGGILPSGFENVTENIANNVDGNLDDYFGTGVEEIESDNAEVVDAMTDAMGENAQEFGNTYDDEYVADRGFDLNVGNEEDGEGDAGCGCLGDVLSSLLNDE